MNSAKLPSPHTRRQALRAVLWACVGLTVCGMIVAVIGIFGLVSAIRDTQKTNSSINRTVLDCSTPDGECAGRNRELVAGAVDNIGRLSVYASACAADVDGSLPVKQRVRVIERCVRSLAGEDSVD